MKVRRRGYTLVDATVAGAVVVILLTVLLPGCYRQNYTPASTRSQCKNNLKQIGLALHNYHSVYLTFPSGWVAVRNAEGEPAPTTVGTFGWLPRILPYMDQGPLFDALDFHDPRGPAAKSNRAHATAKIYGNRCPTTQGPEDFAAGSSHFGTSTYVGNFGVGLPDVFAEGITDGDYTRSSHGVFGCNSRIRIADIKDGTANVIFVGERRLPENCREWPVGQTSGTYCSSWPGIRDVSEVDPLSIVGTATNGSIFDQTAIPSSGPFSFGELTVFSINRNEDGTALPANIASAGFSSDHTGGVNVLICDGSVRFINENISRDVLVNLARRSDAEILGEF